MIHIREIAHIVLRVTDPEATMRFYVETRFGAKGDGPAIYISDPEGNTVELRGRPRVKSIAQSLQHRIVPYPVLTTTHS